MANIGAALTRAKKLALTDDKIAKIAAAGQYYKVGPGKTTRIRISGIKKKPDYIYSPAYRVAGLQNDVFAALRENGVDPATVPYYSLSLLNPNNPNADVQLLA
jgi:hypothetical protein